MQTSYHFNSVSEINIDTINSMKKEFKGAVILTIEDEPQIDTTENQKQFVRESILKYSLNPQLLIDEEEAWEIINAK